MKLSRTAGALGLTALAAAASPYAAANDAGWYIGTNLGMSRANIDDERIARSLLGAGLATTSITDNDREFGYKIFGGYQFSKYFALEGGYFDLGEFGFNASTAPPGTLSGDTRIRGLNLDPVGILPITQNFSAFLRAGVNYAETKSRFSSSGSVTAPRNRDQREANYKAGVGLQYNITQALGVRAEAERYRIEDAIDNEGDVDLFSLGLVYRFFGSTPVAAAAPARAYEPVAAKPGPAAEPVAPVSPRPIVLAPRPTKVVFSTDSFFAFNEATLNPNSRQELDSFSADLRGTDFEIVTVTGHTDRIGSTGYNMQLSADRAETVKTYLVESAGIPVGKIAARGVGESEPVTQPEDCKGSQSSRASKELIACLQPDRRVEVEVTGSK